MSLEHLATLAPNQQLKIDKLIRDGVFSPPGLSDLSVWTAFKESLWKQNLPIAKVQGDGKPLPDAEALPDDEPLPNDKPHPEAAPAARPIVEIPEDIVDLYNLESGRILVRSEYEEAERAVLSANTANIEAFVVTGQPGIGKSVFLIWLLMRRLALRLPTVYQFEEGQAILFHEHGVSQFQLLGKIAAHSELKFPRSSLSRIWVLVDSSQVLTKPAPVFRWGNPFFVVEAASPREPHLEWTKKVFSERFYMKPWTFSEVLQARPFLGLGGPYEEDQLRHLHDTYGASPRMLSRYAPNPDEYRDLIILQVDKLNSNNLRHALQNPDFDESSHLIVLIEPSPTSRSVPQKRISLGVVELLWDRHMKDQVSEMLHFYTLFRSSPALTAAAGWVFEIQMHLLLKQGISIHLFPIAWRSLTSKVNDFYDDYNASNQKETQKDIQLTASADHVLDENAPLIINQYYRPRPTNFPAIDSLLLVHPPGEPSPILLMFQMMLDKDEHDANEGDLCKIERMELPPNTRRYYVLVTPDDIQMKVNAPIKYFKVKGGERKKFRDAFEVFHYPVDADTLSSRLHQ